MTLECYRGTCRLRFSIDPARERRLRKTGEVFYCPAGHGQRFPVEPDPRDRRISLLEQQKAQLARATEDLRDRLMERMVELESLRQTVFGSSALFYCPRCQKRHRFTSEVGEAHLPDALEAVAAPAKAVTA